jgi:hypothetical protein
MVGLCCIVPIVGSDGEVFVRLRNGVAAMAAVATKWLPLATIFSRFEI